MTHSNSDLAHIFYSLTTEILPILSTQKRLQFWYAIESQYTEPHRHYHTLNHLEQMFVLFKAYQDNLNHPKSVALAIFYHDIIYDPTRSDNEQQSADYFIKTYEDYLPEDRSNRVYQLIMMTAKHQLDEQVNISLENDAKYFLDMDLAILGQNWTEYEQYAKQVRLEYQHVPLAEYQQGRIAVLQKFLQRERLYFSAEFSERFERQARENIDRETETLSI